MSTCECTACVAGRALALAKAPRRNPAVRAKKLADAVNRLTRRIADPVLRERYIALERRRLEGDWT